MSNPLVQSTGRRKEAVARVRLRPGSGIIKVNGRTFEKYFPILTHRVVAIEPLRLTQTADVYDEARPQLKKAGLLTRDAREKERRKYGLKKARKAPQYSKR